MLREIKNEILLHSVASAERLAGGHVGARKENARSELRLTGRYFEN
jgi:hypothetical protein